MAAALTPTRRNPLARLFGGVKAAATSTIAFWSPTWMGDQATWTQFKYESLVREAYLKNELIFACVNAKSATAASIGMRVYDSETHEERPNHPLRALLSSPNPYISEHDFWRQAIINLDLAGIAPFQKLRNRMGDVVQLWPLRPDYFTIRRSATEYIAGYSYGPPGQDKTQMAASDVMVFIERDPRDMLVPVSRAQVAGRMVDVDNSATDYIRLYWEKGGAPPGVLTSKMKLTNDQIARARHNWEERYGGFRQWTSPVVLDSDTTYQQIGFSFKEMGFEALDGRSEVRICTVMGVPPIIVGTTIGLMRNTFSNYGEARKAWWEDSLIPFYKKLADQVMMDLVPEFGGGVYVKWDMESVPALQDDQNARWARATAAWSAGAITRNSFNRQVGLPTELNNDVFIVSNMVAITPERDSTADDTSDPTPDDKSAASARAKIATKDDASTVPNPDPVVSEKLTEQYGQQMSDLAAQASTGAISQPIFEARMKELISQAMTAQALAIGPLDDADRKRIEDDAKSQEQYLAGFVKDVINLSTDAASARAMQYAQAARQQYWKQASPVALDLYPGSGQTACKSGCKCSLEFDTDSKPGYCLVTWRLGNANADCEDCRYYAASWNPLEVEMPSGD